MKTKITNKYTLRDLILNRITTHELDSKYDYSSITDMRYMLSGCKSLEMIPLLDTSNVTNMSFMFEDCESLKTIPLIDTSNVTNMSYMFYGCDNLINIDPFNFHLYDFSIIENELFRKKYPELFI